jgi:hypothetical protein
MTQAMNLANFSNSLDSSGGVPPTQLNSVVPVSKGGTNAATAANARTNLDVPPNAGTTATGTWPISVTGSATSLITANFSIEQSGSNLLIKYGATTLITITSAGAMTTSSSITAGGSVSGS